MSNKNMNNKRQCSRCGKQLPYNYNTNMVVYGPYIFCDDCDTSFHDWLESGNIKTYNMSEFDQAKIIMEKKTTDKKL